MPQGIRFAPAEATLKRKEDRSVLDTPGQRFMQMIGDLLGMNDPEQMMPTPAMAAAPAARGLAQTSDWLANQVRVGRMPAEEAKKILGLMERYPDLDRVLANVGELPAEEWGAGKHMGRVVPRNTSDIFVRSGEGAANTFAHEGKHALDHATDPTFTKSYGDWLSKFGYYFDNPWEERAVKFAGDEFADPVERQLMRSTATSAERFRTNPTGAIGGGGALEALRRKENKPKK